MKKFIFIISVLLMGLLMIVVATNKKTDSTKSIPKQLLYIVNNDFYSDLGNYEKEDIMAENMEQEKIFRFTKRINSNYVTCYTVNSFPNNINKINTAEIMFKSSAISYEAIKQIISKNIPGLVSKREDVFDDRSNISYFTKDNSFYYYLETNIYHPDIITFGKIFITK